MAFSCHQPPPTTCVFSLSFFIKSLYKSNILYTYKTFVEVTLSLYQVMDLENKLKTVRFLFFNFNFYCFIIQSITYSLVKLHYFQLAFLENCVYKNQKKSIKDERNFCSNTFLKVFANFVSAHSKIYKQNDINFFIPLIGDLPEIEECLYLTTTMECNSFHI